MGGAQEQPDGSAEGSQGHLRAKGGGGLHRSRMEEEVPRDKLAIGQPQRVCPEESKDNLPWDPAASRPGWAEEEEDCSRGSLLQEQGLPRLTALGRRRRGWTSQLAGLLMIGCWTQTQMGSDRMGGVDMGRDDQCYLLICSSFR